MRCSAIPSSSIPKTRSFMPDLPQHKPVLAGTVYNGISEAGIRLQALPEGHLLHVLGAIEPSALAAELAKAGFAKVRSARRASVNGSSPATNHSSRPALMPSPQRLPEKPTSWTRATGVCASAFPAALRGRFSQGHRRQSRSRRLPGRPFGHDHGWSSLRADRPHRR